jgi:Glycosyltransferase 61
MSHLTRSSHSSRRGRSRDRSDLSSPSPVPVCGKLYTLRKARGSGIGATHACLLLAFSFSIGAVIAVQSERAKLPWRRANVDVSVAPDRNLQPPQLPPLPDDAQPEEWKDRSDEPEHRNRPLPAPKNPHGMDGRETKVERGNDSAFRIYTDDMRRQVGMCRFPNACVDTRGVMYVPNSLKRFRSAISSKCSLTPSYLSFYDPKSDKDILDETMTRSHPETHIAGRRPLRYHIPHMVEDLIASTFLLVPFLQRETTSPWTSADRPFHPPNTTVHCFESNSSLFGTRPYVCGSNPPAVISVLVEERAGLLGWAAGLFALLGASTSKAPLQLMYTKEAFAPEPSMDKLQKKHDEYLKKHSGGRQSLFKPRRACFGSISVPGIGSAGQESEYTIQQSVLLKQSGIEREIPRLPTSATCRLNITIINRPLEQGGVASSPGPWAPERRRIVNVDAIQTVLQQEAKRLKISVNIALREDFGEVPFKEQFDAMQHTHSLISIHGAELANTLFMRRAATVVEIYPFRYTPALFAKMMRLFGLNHQVFIADPDVPAFTQCLLHFNQPNDPSREATERAIERFQQRAATFEAAKRSGNSQALGAYWDAGNFVKMARPCARGQRLVVNPSIVARQALADYERLCYGESESSESKDDLQ